MNIYKIFTDEWNTSVMGNTLVKEVVVLANSEEEAFDIVDNKHKLSFVGDKSKRVIVKVCDMNTTNPSLISVEYNWC